MELEVQRTDAPDGGFGASYEAAFTVHRVVRAEREGHGCGLDTTGFLYRATGNEPSWLLTVRRDALEFQSMSGGRRTFQEPQLTTSVDNTVISAGGGDIELVMSNERCTDSMSGSVFSLTARARLDGEAYTGCATEGSGAAN